MELHGYKYMYIYIYVYMDIYIITIHIIHQIFSVRFLQIPVCRETPVEGRALPLADEGPNSWHLP